MSDTRTVILPNGDTATFTQRGSDSLRGFVRVGGATITGRIDTITRETPNFVPNVTTPNRHLVGATT